MTLVRALSAESLKMKRTLALKMVVLAPVAVVSLTLFMASQAPFSTLQRGTTVVDVWPRLARVNFQFWALLMLPMYVTLQTALIAGLDHADNQWKALFARPVPRWTTYVAKLLVVSAMVTASAAILVISVFGEGKFLNWLDPKLGFGAASPIAAMIRQAAEMTGLSFLCLSIQHWVSLRWRSFSVAVGFGLVATITGFAMLLTAGPHGAWPQYFPWSLPMLIIVREHLNIELILCVSWLAGILASAAGCLEFCRREVG